jgi:hypothetical protein
MLILILPTLSPQYQELTSFLIVFFLHKGAGQVNAHLLTCPYGKLALVNLSWGEVNVRQLVDTGS